METKPLVVLMAEDNEHDIFATRRAWRKNGITNELRIVKNGEECLDYLYRRGAYRDPAKIHSNSCRFFDAFSFTADLSFSRNYIYFTNGLNEFGFPGIERASNHHFYGLHSQYPLNTVL